MPEEMAKSIPSTTIRVARGAGSCPNLASVLPAAGKAPIFTPVQESSGESRFE